MRRRRALLLTCLAAGTTALALTVAPAVADVTPPTVEAALSPGESITVTKTVDVPAVPPKLDFVLDVDLSGSYGDDLPNIKALAPGIFDDIQASVPDLQAGLVTFVDYPFGPWGSASTGDYAYARDQDLTSDKTTWVNAVNGMAVRFGADEPESQLESLYQAATGAGRDVPPAGASLGDVAAGEGISFRPDATKVIAITTDASFHLAGDAGPFPYPGPSFADTVAALNAAGVKVIAIKAPGSTTQMNDLAAATGGAVTSTGSSSSDIATAILSALEELTFTITASAVGCDPLVVSFAPASHTGVSGGTSVSFDETISVPDGTAGGTYTCTVQFLADDAVIGVQTITVTVNSPPDCAAATATPDLLWPPNHKYAAISIGGVTDADGDPVTVTPTGVMQDEPVNAAGSGDGNTSPDATLSPLQVRAERAGTGDGRVYHVAFSAADGAGGTCTGTVTVGVPHDQGAGIVPVDSGPPWFDSTAP